MARLNDCLFQADNSGGQRQFRWLWWQASDDSHHGRQRQRRRGDSAPRSIDRGSDRKPTLLPRYAGIVRSNFVPLMEEILPPADARTMIRRYLWNAEYMLRCAIARRGAAPWRGTGISRRVAVLQPPTPLCMGFIVSLSCNPNPSPAPSHESR